MHSYCENKIEPLQISVKTKHAVQKHGVKYKKICLSVKRISLPKVAQQATNLKTVNVLKGITTLSNKNITATYPKNKTRKW